MSLAEYEASAARLHREASCWLCGIPEREELEDGWRRGRRGRFLMQYLTAPSDRGGVGYPLSVATVGRVNYHFYQGHHGPR